MANFKYSADLLDDALQRAGEKIDGTSNFETRALRYLNRVYQSVWSGGFELDPSVSETWWWLRSTTPGVITMNPIKDSGTVSVTNNSTTATLSATTTPSLAGRFLRVNGHADVFRISAHTSGTDALTLDSVYTGSTDTAASYRIMQIDYTLASDCRSILQPVRAYQDKQSFVNGIEPSALSRNWPLRDLQPGVPQEFAEVGDQTIRFSHCGGTSSTDLIRIDYDYLVIPADLTDGASEEPLVPYEYRRMLADYTLMYLFADKHDSRAADAGNLALQGLRAMAAENKRRHIRMSTHPGGILPRPSNTFKNRSPLRTSSGLIIG